MSAQLVPHLLISHQEIATAVSQLAAQITRDYSGSNPLVVGVLKGSFIFLADLVRLLEFPLEIEFVRLSSYREGMESSGKVAVVSSLRCPVKARDVLLVEDIVDTGLSVACIMEHLRRKNPASLRLCALADKPSRRRVPVTIDYLGFTVPDEFLVGYGLDCDEKFRNLPDIYSLVEEKRTTSRITFVRRY
ncbi:MAG: hypoxanthine phosphoribosyltransferase [Chloroflexi bacterium]|nr:hypoxanthine phosphoribosyltransferase [Chloroflexota bacterium]